MKRYQYILFSIILSTLIVYLSVGMPLVRYNCLRCAHLNASETVVGIVEVHDDGSSCDCSAHSKCSCGKHHSHAMKGHYKDNTQHEYGKGNGSEANAHQSSGSDDETADNQTTDDENGGCSKVNIVKINLPILTSSIHLDEAVYPVIDLSVFNYLSDISQLYHDDVENTFIDDTSPTLTPRDYINTICTLII